VCGSDRISAMAGSQSGTARWSRPLGGLASAVLSEAGDSVCDSFAVA
jgi:hypothetical protein